MTEVMLIKMALYHHTDLILGNLLWIIIPVYINLFLTIVLLSKIRNKK